MVSNDVKNLELFIDNYLAPGERVSPPMISQRNNSYSYNGACSLTNSQVSQLPRSSTGTELWGEKTGGSEWQTIVQKPSHENSEYRPGIQNRSLQWKLQTPQAPVPEQFQAVRQPENLSCFSQMPIAPQNPNHIQSLVFDLIRQNNMKKSTQFNIPPWVDVTKPPPPLPNCMPVPNVQYNSQVQPPINNHFEKHEAIPTMNFQQSFNSNMQFGNPDNLTNPASAPMLPEVHQQHVDDLSKIHYAMQNNHQIPSDSKQKKHLPLSSASPFAQDNSRLVLDHYKKKLPPLKSASLEEDFVNTPDLLQQKSKAEDPYDQFQPQKNTQFSAQDNDADNINATKSTVLKTQPVEFDKNAHFPETVNQNTGSVNSCRVEKTLQQPQNNNANNSRNNSENSACEQLKRNSNSFNKKRTFYRQPSAADLDMNWRSRDDTKDQKEAQDRGDGFRRSSFDNAARRSNSRSFAHQGAGDDEVVKPTAKDNSAVAQTCHFQERETNKIADAESNGARHVTAKSKVKLLSWLQQNNENSSDDWVTKEIRHLQISNSEFDLNRLIEVSQRFATNEAKMREIAEILCNKALGDPRFARNVALLCDRLSFMMVHGTKFRNVVLNVMQGHYKNREQIFAASFRGNVRWFGFVTFLVEIFLNMRTSTRERLLVLTTPVLNCLFQVLHGEKVTQDHIDCFGQLFRKVGPALEAESVIRLDKLMEEIRDRCVTCQAPFVKRVLLHCVELYASKWEAVPC